MPPTNRNNSSPSTVQSDPSGDVSEHEQMVSELRPIAKCNIFGSGSVQFCTRVRGLRSLLGLTVDSAAKLWGYSRNTVINWEAGKSAPTWPEWDAIERAAIRRIRRAG